MELGKIVRVMNTSPFHITHAVLLPHSKLQFSQQSVWYGWAIYQRCTI